MREVANVNVDRLPRSDESLDEMQRVYGVPHVVVMLHFGCHDVVPYLNQVAVGQISVARLFAIFEKQ